MDTGINRNPPVRPNFNTAQPLRRNVQPVAPRFYLHLLGPQVELHQYSV